MPDVQPKSFVVSKRKTTDWIQTFSGKRFYPLEPDAKDVCIEDIAHALAMKCRFAGQCLLFYSVAQHSVLVSNLVPKEDALQGLLHDAAEAYFADIPRPIKREHKLFKQIEDKIMYAVKTAFRLSLSDLTSVHDADMVMLATEARDLMGDITHWTLTQEPTFEKIVPWTWEESEQKFLLRFNELTQGCSDD